jgi:Protein of unknown function (DUF4240)
MTVCRSLSVMGLIWATGLSGCSKERDSHPVEKGVEALAPSPPPTTSAAAPRDEAAQKRAIDRDGFWKIVDQARSGVSSDEQFLERFAARLRQLDADELVDVQRQIDSLRNESYGWPLWGACYLINGGCSDDGFEYFRAWLIAQGRERFERAVEDPDTLADIENPDAELESFLYVATDAYEAKTGAVMERVVDTAAQLTPDDAWDFDDSFEMLKRYPRLHARHGRAR